MDIFRIMRRILRRTNILRLYAKLSCNSRLISVLPWTVMAIAWFWLMNRVRLSQPISYYVCLPKFA
ncbi:Uncharacterised protein [Mycobacteroides abscessus]|nr:Uncharacterised protein [Mycobacteroides abscessus]